MTTATVEALEPLLTPEQAAEYLSVSRSFVYSAVDKGLLPSARVGKLLRFRPEDLRRWVADQVKASLAKEEVKV